MDVFDSLSYILATLNKVFWSAVHSLLPSFDMEIVIIR